MQVAIVDDVMGAPGRVGTVSFQAITITVRDLIRARVELFVEGTRDQSAFAAGGFGGVLALSEHGRDPDRLVADAEAAFVHGRYFLLLDDRQASALDEEVDLAATSEVTFLLVTPLKGG